MLSISQKLDSSKHEHARVGRVGEEVYKPLRWVLLFFITFWLCRFPKDKKFNGCSFAPPISLLEDYVTTCHVLCALLASNFSQIPHTHEHDFWFRGCFAKYTSYNVFELRDGVGHASERLSLNPPSIRLLSFSSFFFSNLSGQICSMKIRSTNNCRCLQNTISLWSLS